MRRRVGNSPKNVQVFLKKTHTPEETIALANAGKSFLYLKIGETLHPLFEAASTGRTDLLRDRKKLACGRWTEKEARKGARSLNLVFLLLRRWVAARGETTFIPQTRREKGLSKSQSQTAAGGSHLFRNPVSNFLLLPSVVQRWLMVVTFLFPPSPRHTLASPPLAYFLSAKCAYLENG